MSFFVFLVRTPHIRSVLAHFAVGSGERYGKRIVWGRGVERTPLKYLVPGAGSTCITLSMAPGAHGEVGQNRADARRASTSCQVIKLSLALATAIPLSMGVSIMKASFRDAR